MLCILIEFQPRPGKEDAFIEAWSRLTEYIHEHYGSKGSRLHRNTNGTYIAYAQWPDKETYEATESTPEAERLREEMMQTLEQDGIRIRERLDVVADLLKH